MLDDVDEGLKCNQTGLSVELVLHRLNQMIGEELSIRNQRIR